MPDEQFLYDYKEVVESLIKKQGLHEGLWAILIEFGLGASNVPTAQDGSAFAPAAVTIVQKIGIKRADRPNNLTVDAAEVNPAPGGAKKATTKKAGGKKQQR